MNQYNHPLENSLSKNDSKDVIRIIPKDAYVLFVFWELAFFTQTKFEAAFGKELWEKSDLVIKLLNLSKNSNKYWKINNSSDSTYINLSSPNCIIKAEIGKLVSNNFFISFAESNIITMPNNSIVTNDTVHFENINESRKIAASVNTDKIYKQFKFNQVSKNPASHSGNLFISIEKRESN